MVPEKTTLFKMITRQEEADAGTLRIGDTVTLGYMDQNRELLDPEKTIWEVISDGQDTIQLGDRKLTRAPTWPALTSPEQNSRKRWI